MTKHIFILLFLLISRITVFAQVTATDFTATDCNAVSHTLFTELDNGKIIVLLWVMPCGACISDAIAAYDAVQSFAVSHPGKVKLYLIDDVGNASCATLSAWAATNSVVPDAMFGNAGVPIDENDYGGGGMPHVVVTGGTNHKIFLNIKDGSNNETAITNAISEAINPTAISETNENPAHVQLFPNPVKDKLTLHYTIPAASDVNITILDLKGSVMQSMGLPQQIAGEHIADMDLASFSNGVYFLQLKAAELNQKIKFTVTH